MRALRWIGGVLAGLVLLVAAVGGAGLLYLRTGLPQTEGTLRVAGLEGPVEIVRDGFGIPHVWASAERDLWFALGFLHAQDRLVQLEFTRLIGQGRLAEAVGARALPLDRFNRVLGLPQEARRAYAIADADTRAQMDAYAAGANASLAARGGAWPVEFLWMGHRPERWEGWHTLLWGQMMGLTLNAGWRDALMRARLGDRLTPDLFDALWPRDDGSAAAVSFDPADRATEKLAGALLDALPAPLGPPTASNEWVVAGSRTASGKPILANDPHLNLGAPGVWYLVRLEAPGAVYAGATAPGAPALVLGRNANIAWGFTTTNADASDLFLERVDPADATRYLVPGGSRAFETREEILQIRGERPQTIVVRRTRHGAVISDIDPIARATAGDGHAMALALPFMFAPDRTAQALMKLNRAKDAREAVAATRDWLGPVQNMVYADTSGTIGLRTVGAVPTRATAPSPLPYRGWMREVGWTGFVPFEEMPSRENPPAGFVSNANDRVVAANWPHHLGFSFDPTYRQRRIVEVLGSRTGQDAAFHEALLADAHSLFAREAVAAAAQLAPTELRTRAALERLRAWDGRMDRTRGEPLIFAAWMRELTRRTLEIAAGDLSEALVRERPRLLLDVLNGRSKWCGDGGEAACARAAEAALAAALDWIAARHGRNVAAWQWGAEHRAPFDNPVFARLPLIGPLLDVGVPTHGDYYTVNRGGGRMSEAAHPFAHVHGAGYRAVYDLADLDASLFVIAPGQSGDILSTHWRDMAALWADGRHVRLARSRVELGEDSRRLRLLPP
ncbi:MAG: penicillin acylase family protein [Rhodospirillales bacterium]|nr:penicillin acylase family protein [Rhodospirillales bacterium]